MRLDVLSQAALDMRFLLDRGYPRKSASELVAQRYGLSGRERNLLYRCVFSWKEAIEVRGKLISEYELKGKRLCIDGYNVLITVESWLKDSIVVKCDDSLLRDITGSYGKHSFSEHTERAVEILIVKLKELEVKDAVAYFDSGVSYSGELCRYIERAAEKRGVPLKAETAKRADMAVLSCNGIICSSDRVVVSRAKKVFDLAASVIPPEDVVVL